MEVPKRTSNNNIRPYHERRQREETINMTMQYDLIRIIQKKFSLPSRISEVSIHSYLSREAM